MARLPYVDLDQLAEKDRDLLARPINLYRQLANSPEALRHYQPFGQWTRYRGPLDPRLRELAILQVGYLARAPYEWSHHIKIGRDFGVSDDDIRAVMTETDGGDSGLPALDRTVLRAARQMTTEMRIHDAEFAVLREALNDDELVQLILTIGHYNSVVRVLATLEIDVEPEYQPYLDAFPLPS